MRTTSKFSDNSPISTFYYASTLLATKYNFQVLEVLGGSFLPHKVRIALNEEGNFQGQSPMRVVSLLQQRLPVVENVQVSGTVDGSARPMNEPTGSNLFNTPWPEMRLVLSAKSRDVAG